MHPIFCHSEASRLKYKVLCHSVALINRVSKSKTTIETRQFIKRTSSLPVFLFWLDSSAVKTDSDPFRGRGGPTNIKHTLRSETFAAMTLSVVEEVLQT